MTRAECEAKIKLKMEGMHSSIHVIPSFLLARAWGGSSGPQPAMNQLSSSSKL